MRIYRSLGMAAAAIGVLAGCSADRLNVPEMNNPTPGAVASDPVVALNFAAGGIITRDRADFGAQILANGIYGREAFNYTPTDSRNTTGYLVNPDDPTSFGSGNFQGRFQTLKNIQNFYRIIEDAKALITPVQAQAATGFAKTFEGLTFLYYIGSRHNLGGPVEIPVDPTDIKPFVSRDSVYSVALIRLNEGLTALTAGGPTFPFSLTAGFVGFNTPANFAKFNRAIAARLLAYRGSLSTGATRTQFYQQALTALAASFINPGGSLTTGVFHVYSTAAGDLSNPINTATSVNVLGHPSNTVDATPGDLRLSKLRTIASRTAPGGATIGIPTTVGFARYADQATPIPIVRNEELILLRAEARYFTGDQAGALADLNDVRTRAGGLPALSAGDIDSESKFVDRLLYERRYSLLLEGFRWIDVRRFGRLNTLPLDLASHVRALQQVVPLAECQARARTGDPALKGTGCP